MKEGYTAHGTRCKGKAVASTLRSAWADDPRASSAFCERISQYDRFFPTRAYGNDRERNLDHFFDPFEIIPGGSREIIPFSCRGDVFLPPWQLFVDRNASGKSLEAGGHGLHSFSIQLIGHAYLQCLQTGEHVELRDAQTGEPVEPGGILDGDKVQPTA